MAADLAALTLAALVGANPTLVEEPCYNPLPPARAASAGPSRTARIVVAPTVRAPTVAASGVVRAVPARRRLSRLPQDYPCEAVTPVLGLPPTVALETLPSPEPGAPYTPAPADWPEITFGVPPAEEEELPGYSVLQPWPTGGFGGGYTAVHTPLPAVSEPKKLILLLLGGAALWRLRRSQA